MRFIQLLLVGALLGGCFNTPKESKDNTSSENEKSIQQLEARINELNQRLAQGSSAQSDNTADIEQLRSELTQLMDQSTRLLEDRLNILEGRMGSLRLSIDSNTANLAQLSLLRDQINDETLVDPPQVTVNIDSLSAINERLDALEADRATIQSRIDEAVQAAEARWETNLAESLEASSGRLTDEIQAMIIEERERLQIDQAQLRAQIQQLDATQTTLYVSQSRLEREQDELSEQVERLNHTEETPVEYDNTSNEEAIAALRGQLTRVETRLENLGQIDAATEDQALLSALNRRMYEPCYESLADDNYCLNQAAAIRRLGGEFIDPMTFERTRAGLLEYLALSGITLPALMDRNKIDTMIAPSSNRRESFDRCNEQDGVDIEHAIAPNHQWPRLVVLALVVEKANAALETLQQNGELDMNVRQVSNFVAWWRSTCYQRANFRARTSDHMFGAGIDFSFSGHPGNESFEFYKEYIRKHIWDNDTYGVVSPLQTSGLVMRIGVGMGHGSHGNGQLHLGIFSEEEDSVGNRMQWTYGSRNHGAYEERL